jgi:hypothetical protein
MLIAARFEYALRRASVKAQLPLSSKSVPPRYDFLTDVSLQKRSFLSIFDLIR